MTYSSRLPAQSSAPISDEQKLPAKAGWLQTFAENPAHSSKDWNLGLLIGISEGLGFNASYRLLPWLALEGFLTHPTSFRIKLRVPARTLVERDGFAIRSPKLILPINLLWGPHAGAGLMIFPNSKNFFFNTSYEYRQIKIDSILESPLEIVDPTAQVLTNTVFHAEAHAVTRQDLLRITFGYTWDLAEHPDLILSFFAGLAHPLSAHSKIQTKVNVLNPSASDPDQVLASNLQEAERRQEYVLNEDAVKALRKIETMNLPSLGLVLSWRL